MKYSQTPAAGYLNLPQAEIWQSSPMMFNFQKCDPLVDRPDSECGSAPYAYSINLNFFVQALNPANQVVASDDNVSLNINVVNPCGADELAFMTPITSFVYQIDQNGAQVDKFPTLSQLHTQCLRQCTLTVTD